MGSLEITGGFIDEVNQITVKAKNIVKSRIRYKLDEYDLIPKLLMTCNPSKNWVYSEFFSPDKKKSLPKYRKFIQALLSDNKHISEHYEANLLTLDENSKQRLLKGNWDYDDDPTTLIDFDVINGMWTNDHVEKGNGYIVSDVARFGSDKAIITVWLGFVLVEYVMFATSKTTDMQNAINALRVKYRVSSLNTIADEDGIGGGVVDSCKIKGFVNNSKPVNSNYSNLKSECGYLLAKNAHKIYIEADIPADEKQKINEELSQLKTFDSDKDNKLKILPKSIIKDNIGRSPDWLDCFIMRMYYELPIKRKAKIY